MSTLDKLRADYEQAEAKAQKIMAEKDDAIAKIRDKYTDRLRTANDDAAAAQKRLLDAEVVEALRDRPDGEQIARQRADEGGLAREAVDAAFG